MEQGKVPGEEGEKGLGSLDLTRRSFRFLSFLKAQRGLSLKMVPTELLLDRMCQLEVRILLVVRDCG